MNAQHNPSRALLLIAVSLGIVAASTAQAQIAFRSATSAFISGGGGTPTAPAFRSSSTAVLVAGGNVTKRLYPENVTTDVDPPTLRGNWPHGGTATHTKIRLSRAITSRTATSAGTARGGTLTNPGQVLVTKFVSEPLAADQTISGTLNWVLGASETNAGLNAYWKLYAYVLRGADTSVGTLLDYTELTTSANEWTTTAVGKGAGGVIAQRTLTSVAAQVGDRIVIETGYVTYATRTDTGRVSYSAQGASTTGLPELTIGGNAGAGAGWFEFSQDIFGSTIRKPIGTIADDVMVATVSVRPHTATITPPAGWTLVRRIDNATSPTSSLAIYYRAADATDSSVQNYAFSTSGATSALATIRTFSGADTANPIDIENGVALAVASDCSNTCQYSAPAVTTTLANTLLVASYATGAGTVIWSNFNSGMTENFSSTGFPSGVTGNSSSTSFKGMTVVQATAGASGAKTAGYQPISTNYPGIAHILALRGPGAGGSTTLTINKPAGVVQNDMMIASINVGPSSATINPPSGWALVRRMNNATGTTNSLAVYSKLAGASEPANYSWTLSSGHTGAAGGIQAFSGADPTIEVENGQNTVSGTSHATPSVTTGLANTMLVASHGVGAASTTWTPPAGMAEGIDAQGGTQAVEMSYVLQAGAGGSGAKSATSSASGTGNAHILALRRVIGSFNAFEISTAAGAITGVIKTKVAGTSVSVATTALNAVKGAVATTYVGTVRVEVLDASDNSAATDANGCRATWTPIQTLTPDITFTAADNGRKNITFTVANSYRDVRLRISAPVGAPDTIGCSTDNFALRPNQFINVEVTDNDSQTAGTGRALNSTAATGGNVHKAGQPFTVRATAVNGAGTPATTTNYTGTPTGTVSQCGAGGACLATLGTFTAGGSFVAGELNTTAATYSEAAAFALELLDDSFANVDAGDGSIASERNITSPAINVGRFVPDRFEFASPSTPQLRTFGTASCGARSFTYIGQPFWYVGGQSPGATLNAVNAAGAVTTNYTVDLALSKPAISETFADGSAPAAAPLDSGSKGAASLSGGAGTGTYSAAAGGLLSYTRGTSSSSTVAPFSAAISLTVTASDATEAGVTGNGTITTPTPLVFNGGGSGITFDGSNFNTAAGLTGGKTLVYGRLRLANANGSQLVPLRVRAETQYWANSALGFVTNTADSCTSIANNNVQMSGFTANLAACETAITAPVTLSSGRGILLLLPPGNANNGSVLLTANLGGASSGTTCTSVGGGTVSAAGANLTYLQGNWDGAAFDDDPEARAAFGVFRGAEEVIFIRENF
jgi:MSHA biogenesis protein MshQ